MMAITLLALGYAQANTGPLRADGGTVRLSEIRGDRRITVFTSPTPLRAGPVDVSVLVQDLVRGRPLIDVPIMIRAWPTQHVEDIRQVAASSEAATNKLMRAALVELPEPGEWHVEVIVHGETPLGFDVEVAEPTPAWLDMIAWIGWPLGAIGIFALQQWLTYRRQ